MDYIFLAGDIGSPDIIGALDTICPVVLLDLDGRSLRPEVITIASEVDKYLRFG